MSKWISKICRWSGRASAPTARLCTWTLSPSHAAVHECPDPSPAYVISPPPFWVFKRARMYSDWPDTCVWCLFASLSGQMCCFSFFLVCLNVILAGPGRCWMCSFSEVPRFEGGEMRDTKRWGESASRAWRWNDGAADGYRLLHGGMFPFYC